MKKELIKLIVGKKNKKELEKIEVKKILIETSWQLGDCIINSPLLENLVKNNEDLEIDIIVRENSMDMYKYVPYIKNIYPYRSHKNKILRYINRMIFAIKNRNKYDVIISFESGINTFHLLWLKVLNAKFLMSLEKREKYGITKEDIKLVDYYFRKNIDILKEFKISNIDKKYKVYLGKYEEYAKDFFDNSKVNVIFNYIGSFKNKTLKIEEVKKIMIELAKQDINIFISSTPNKYLEVKELVEKIGEKNVKLLPKTENIFEVASYIKYSGILVSVDTSLIHIASSYDKKVLGLYMKNEDIIEYAKPRCENYFIIKSKYKDKIEELDLQVIISSFKKLLTKYKN